LAVAEIMTRKKGEENLNSATVAVYIATGFDLAMISALFSIISLCEANGAV